MAKKKNKKHDIDWLMKCLGDAKQRGINTFSFHSGSGMHPHCPEIYEVGVSNLTGVTIYLESSKWDEDQEKQKQKEENEELEIKKHKRMIEIWNNSPETVRQKFIRTLISHIFVDNYFLTKKESKELSKVLNRK